MQTRTFQPVALQQHQPSALRSHISIKCQVNIRARQIHAAAARDWQAPVAAAAVQHRQHTPRLQPSPLQQQPAWICRTSLASQATPDPIPDGELGSKTASSAGLLAGCLFLTCDWPGWLEMHKCGSHTCSHHSSVYFQSRG
jgi:hypothetical protein